MPYKDPEARRAWHRRNQERARERAKEWRKANPEKMRAQNAKRLALHSERERKRSLAWREANPEKVKAYRETYVRDPEQVRRHNRRRSEARAATPRDNNTRDYAVALMRDPCSYCGDASTGVDHIVPLASNGSDTWENFTACCAHCNCRKNASPLLDWLARRY